MDIKNSQAYIYAKRCVNDESGRIGKYVKKQCAEWLLIADGKTENYICADEYARLMNVLGIIIHPDTLKPLSECMDDYAAFFLTAVLCTKRPDGERLYTTALLEIARKNRKTFYSGVVFVYSMLTEKRFSRLFSVAPDFKLSSELRLAVRKLVKCSPMLEAQFKLNRDFIRCFLTDIEYIPLAYSNDRMDGKLAQVFLADEAGGMDSYPVEAMRSSQIDTPNKLGIIISTQYPNEKNVLTDEIEKAKKSLDKLEAHHIREDYFALLYEPDDEIKDNWKTDDNVLYQANPVAIDNKRIFDTLKKLRADAAEYENTRENFLCKHCNIRYRGLGTEMYIDAEYVQRAEKNISDEWWRDRNVYLGVDLSQTDDNTSVAMAAYVNGIIYAKVWAFVPQGRIEYKSKKEEVNYNKSIRDGECFGCGIDVIDYGFIEKFILDLRKKYGVKIIGAGFDPYNARSSMQKLENADEPVTCIETKQHSSVLHPATKLVKERIMSGEMVLCRNKLLEINFENARCRKDTNLNLFVDKKRSGGKVDMVVALINAVHILNDNEILDGGFWCFSI